ncbi:MAG: hypothetical protein H0V17_28705 [Deltaproteobacteria bacterium]|nr:hypothetical protein [Deltaproteobacteria bacterium]
MRASDKQDIHEIIGRDLDATEAATYESMDAIPAPVEAVALTISNRDVILACKYLHDRVPGGHLSDAKVTLEAIMERATVRESE